MHQSIWKTAAALSDQTRLQVVALLLGRTASVGQIADALGTAHSTASHHVGLLERAGLVSCERSGRQTRVRVRRARAELVLAALAGE